MTRNDGSDPGETLAAAVREEIARLGLVETLTVQYIPERRRVRLTWASSDTPDDAIDFPTHASWNDRLHRFLQLYASSRGTRGVGAQ